LRDGGCVLSRECRAGRREPPECAIEVRTPDSRPTLDDCEPVGREDERRDLRSELFCSSKRSAVQLGALALAELERDLQLNRCAIAVSLERDTPRALAESNQLRVCARAR
jgi:hypothetical protein